MGQLILIASGFHPPGRWCWRLLEEAIVLADHEVNLDTSSWQFGAYSDLRGYLIRHFNQTNGQDHESAALCSLGEWVGAEILGPIGEVLVQRARKEPITVHVTVSDEGSAPILNQPLELALVEGKPLSLHRVSLVFDFRALVPAEGDGAENPLPMLVAFSLPSDAEALKLRRERHQLQKMLKGWDIIPFSGYGLVKGLQRWEEDSTLMEQVIVQNKSQSTVERWWEALLLDGARRAEDPRTASAELTRMSKPRRSEAALKLIEPKGGATQAGPWSLLRDKSIGLRHLNELGRFEEVLGRVKGLREEMGRLDESSDQEEAVQPWNVRETVLNTGYYAALMLERWEEGLVLSDEVQASQRRRGATELEQARTRFNDYGPLLRLERLPEARELLVGCIQAFEGHNAYAELGSAFTALAQVDAELGRHDRSVEEERRALRYKYLAGSAESCAISHFNLATHLGLARPDAQRQALAHHLASGIIRLQTQSGLLAQTLSALARHRPRIGFDEVVLLVEQVEGVRFRELFDRLPKGRAATGREALARVLAMAEA